MLRLIKKRVRSLRPADNFKNGATLMQRDREELLKKFRYFYFLCVQKVFSSHHKIQIEPLMADGLF